MLYFLFFFLGREDFGYVWVFLCFLSFCLGNENRMKRESDEWESEFIEICIISSVIGNCHSLTLLFRKQRVKNEDYLQSSVYVVIGVWVSLYNEFILFTEGHTVAAAAAVSTRKVPFFASSYGRSESGSGPRSWLSGALALPAAGLDNNTTYFEV